jgi:hypothetical protein
MPAKKGTIVAVEWGYDRHEIHLTQKNWLRHNCGNEAEMH